MSSNRSEDKSEYENVYLMDNPMYQVLSVLLMDNEGNNVCHNINRLASAIENNNKILGEFMARQLKKEQSTTTTAKKEEPKKVEESKEDTHSVQSGRKKRRVRVSPTK